MTTRPLVIITTRLPPQVCGIGTYSWLLHQHWPGRVSNVRFVVVDGAIKSGAELDVSDLTEFNANAGKLARLLDRIGEADVLLHYAGRAYHRFGCPVWFPAVLAKWKGRYPSGRLLALFHELPGNFPITSRYFWIDMCNGRVIRRLAKLADVVVTNTSHHAEKLKQISDRLDVHWFPVPSNIPITAATPSARIRTEFVVFGLPFSRWQTLELFDADIRSWQASGYLTKLHLIGPPDQKFDARSDELISRWRDPRVVVRHGMLSVGDVSKVLSRTRFGLSNATPENWSKSAVFMAFASHGCTIVGRTRSDTAPLRFAVAANEVSVLSDVDLDERANALRQWYEEHADWNVVAKRIFALLPAIGRSEVAK